MLIAMIATKDIERGGISAAEGARVSVTPIQAAMLKYQGLARFATATDDTPEPAPIPEPEPAPPPIAARTTRRRTYRRRDMVAEK